jgi:hypothetical protein
MDLSSLRPHPDPPLYPVPHLEIRGGCDAFVPAAASTNRCRPHPPRLADHDLGERRGTEIARHDLSFAPADVLQAPAHGRAPARPGSVHAPGRRGRVARHRPDQVRHARRCRVMSTTAAELAFQSRAHLSTQVKAVRGRLARASSRGGMGLRGVFRVLGDEVTSRDSRSGAARAKAGRLAGRRWLTASSTMPG